MRISTIASFIKGGVIAISAAILLSPVIVLAWGDNYVDPETGEENGRPGYTLEDINTNKDGLWPTDPADPNYPGKVVLNSIIDNSAIGGDEKDFVNARECFLREDGSWEGSTEDTIWSSNNITVEDEKYYIIRLYVHNNNPNGEDTEDAVAQDVHVAFNLPSAYDAENKRIRVSGIINSSNATPSEYWDHVDFNSDVPFHLEYLDNSGLLWNNDIGLGGLILSDDVVKAASGGTLIGYDALDGRIPGCFDYTAYVTIRVKAVYDYEYTIDQKVRIVDSEKKDWEDVIKAKVGDKVQFRVEYRNTSNLEGEKGWQNGVGIKDILPANLRYVSGSTTLVNSSNKNGLTITNDYVVGDNGLYIGNYAPGTNAILYFIAEIVDDDLAEGVNTITSWAQAGVGSKTIQDNASIILYKNATWFYIVTTILLILIALCLVAIAVLLFCRRRINGNHK